VIAMLQFHDKTMKKWCKSTSKRRSRRKIVTAHYARFGDEFASVIYISAGLARQIDNKYCEILFDDEARVMKLVFVNEPTSDSYKIIRRKDCDSFYLSCEGLLKLMKIRPREKAKSVELHEDGLLIEW